MEDAHVARTDIPLPSSYCSSDAGNDDGGGDGGGGGAVVKNKARVFAVFDGHGGAEVARFCQINLVKVLTSQEAWKNMSKSSAGTAAAAVGSDDEAAMQNFDTNYPEAKLVGQALIDSFHALDRMIDDPNCRGDIEKWRMERPPPYVSGEQKDEEAEQSESMKEIGYVELQPAVEDGEDVQQRRHTVIDPNEIADEDLADDDDTDVEAEANKPCDTDSDDLENKEADGVVHDDSDDEKVEVNNTNENDDGEIAGTTDGDDAEEEKGTVTLASTDAVSLFQKLLHLNLTDDDDSDEDDEEGDSCDIAKVNGYSGEQDSGEVEIPTKEQLLNPPTGIVAPSASVPTKIQNGRKVCLVHVSYFIPPTMVSTFDFLTFFFHRHRLQY